MADREKLLELLVAAGIDRSLVGRLAHFGALLLETNRHFNVSGANTPEALAPHIEDSLLIATYVHSPLIDIGSGGGLPAVPVAIATGSHITMVESTTKKAAFLESLLGQLALRAGRARAGGACRAGILIFANDFRARRHEPFRPFPTVLELTLPFLAVGGVAVLQRGRLDESERNAASDAAGMLGGEITDEIRVPGDRRILLVRKTSLHFRAIPSTNRSAGKAPALPVADVPRGTVRYRTDGVPRRTFYRAAKRKASRTPSPAGSPSSRSSGCHWTASTKAVLISSTVLEGLDRAIRRARSDGQVLSNPVNCLMMRADLRLFPSLQQFQRGGFPVQF